MTNKDKIKELKDQGFKVYIAHLRPVEPVEVELGILHVDGLWRKHEIKNRGWSVSPRGGETHVNIWDVEKGESVAHGIAVSSKKDQFNKRTGLSIALGRALKQVENNHLVSIE